MLAIRLQRLGRKGYPVYRVAVQEAHRHPSSGRVVSYVGSYNPHTKEAKIEKELAEKYLYNGAQPTPRVVKLLEEAGIEMPKWVKKLVRSKMPKNFAATNQKKKLPKKLKTKKNHFSFRKVILFFDKRKSQQILPTYLLERSILMVVLSSSLYVL